MTPQAILGLARRLSTALSLIKQSLPVLNGQLAVLQRQLALLQSDVAALKLRQSATLLATARAFAASGDHRILFPTERSAAQSIEPRHLRIGLYGNMANNAFIMARAMRRCGYQADVVLSDFFDASILNRPVWEAVEFEVPWRQLNEFPIPAWDAPAYVRSFKYDQEFGQEIAAREDALEFVTRMFKDAFDCTLPADVSYLLSSCAAHWAYIRSFADYDILVFMGGPMMVAPFSPIPYALYPLGGDRTITPFEETLIGLLTRAAYGRSHAVFMSAPYFKEWYDRLGVTSRCAMSDFFIDTDVYAPGSEPELRGQWSEAVGGEVFVFQTCRQSWQYKGNDKLIRAFAEVHEKLAEMRLVLTEWGDDIELTRSLARELGVVNKIWWVPLASKPLVARRQRAADIVVDQLVMPSFGTSIMESMAAEKPVIANFSIPDMPAACYKPPPLVVASSVSGVVAALQLLASSVRRTEIGNAGRAWIIEFCGHEAAVPKFVQQLLEIVSRPMKRGWS